MVHALITTRRLLRPHGMLVDLRTDRFSSTRARHDQLYCLMGDRRLYVGPRKIKKPLADFRASDRAIREVLRRALFRLNAVEVIEIRSFLKTLADLGRADAATPYAGVEGSTRRRLSVLLRRHPGARIMVVARGRLNVLVKA
jgi:hypothetical protein